MTQSPTPKQKQTQISAIMYQIARLEGRAFKQPHNKAIGPKISALLRKLSRLQTHNDASG